VHVPWSITLRITYGQALTVVVIVWLARRQGAAEVKPSG
jgi:hypothetical protein